MRHRLGWNRLNRDPKRRKILLRKLVTALIQHERIMTTLPRAKELRRTGDKMVTLAKRGTPQAREKAWNWLQNPELMKKLYDVLKERFVDRPGGYTRVLRAPKRVGDKAQMAIIEFVDNEFPPLRPPREKHSGSIKSILQVGTGKDEDGENIESLNEKLATVGLNDGESVGFSSSVDKEYLKESKDLGTPV